MTDTSRYLRETEAAQILGLQPTTLTRWRWAGKGPAYRKFGGAVRYSEADLTTFADGAQVSQ